MLSTVIQRSCLASTENTLVKSCFQLVSYNSSIFPVPLFYNNVTQAYASPLECYMPVDNGANYHGFLEK